MDQEIRNKLRNVVTQCRKLLEDAISQELEGKYGIFARKDQVTADPNATMSHLSDEDQVSRRDILDHFAHIKARGFKPKEALDQLVREIAFTHLNRLCAYKMMEAREVYVGGQKFREAVSRGVNSNGVKFYLAEHEDDERLYNTGHQDLAYRHFLDWLGGTLSEEIGVLFNPNDPANRLYPRQKTLDEVLDLLNGGGIKAEETELREQWPKIWAQDETIGWVYQYFTPKELRDQARKESQAPRNSYELAFRNQFFTPRYVVEFLTDNTLGRTWYEMRKGDTTLKDQCRYLVRRPTEIFLKDGEQQPASLPSPSGRGAEGEGERNDLSQEELLKLPVYISHRPKKDPRELKILDPACGSGHFLLYCFDLLLTIYEEAFTDPDLGPALQADYPTLDALKRDVPRLILAHNLHGIDIDLRASQIAALALWLRCQRAYQEMGLKKERPKITRSNFVCAEPMPGEETMLKEFVGHLEPKVLGQVVEVVFDKMKLAGEAGSLLKIEEELRDAVAEAKKQWVRETAQATDRKGQPLLFTQSALDELDRTPEQQALFDFSDLTDTQFFEQAEAKVIEALRRYAEKAHNGQQLQRRLFTNDAVRGFAFIDLCQKRYDVVLMNPPFGDASLPSQPYIQDVYADTKGDVYKSFVECFQDRLIPAGFLGIISSRSGFFLGQSADWRERIVLRLYRPLVLADFGLGVLDAMVETAAYVLRSIDEDEDKQLTLRLLNDVTAVETDKSGYFSIPKYQHRRGGLRRHQANGELRRLLDAGYIVEMPGAFRRFSAQQKAVSQAPKSCSIRQSLLPCFRLSSEKKDRLLRSMVESLRKGGIVGNCFLIDLTTLHQVPGSTFAYWVSDGLRRLFVKLQPLKDSGRHACITNPAGDDRRYFRCAWEVPPHSISRTVRWVPLAKGGVFSRYYSDIHLLIDWDEKEQTYRGFEGTIHRPLKRPASVDWFFQPGITYSRRSQLGFSARVLPAGCIFHDKGPAIFTTEIDRWFLLGLMNSKAFAGLLKMQMAFGSYEIGVVQRTPVPVPTKADRDVLVTLARKAVDLKRFREATLENSNSFILPALLCYSGKTLFEQVESFGKIIAAKDCELAALQDRVDEIAFELYNFSQKDRHKLEEHVSEGEKDVTTDLEQDTDDDSSQPPPIDERVLVADVISYSMGSAFGRWDIRIATNDRPKPELPDPFAALPACSPGMLQRSGGFASSIATTSYPLRIDSDGITPDDPDHTDDIVHRVREVLELIWKGRADSIEKEACDFLGVKELRDYFRKPGKGGFWDDHIARYSKSRRKAPIYWLLQSPKKNYALWLYYHRLDKDLLFKALVNYVEPKIRLETSRLESLRSQKATTGDSGKEAKRLAKEAEKQEDFLSELRDFEDKLRRAANRHLEPDLNDGVVLNIAPLHELVPWKEARKYWDELLGGKYEWSSIGKQLREKGLIH